MAVSLVSNYGIGDANLNNLMSSTDDQRIGFHQSSLSEWNTTTVPVVKEGTRFECNGGLYEVTSDTSIGGSPSDGKVFIYFDESALGFTFTNTAPTWDDDKQGWYVGSSNDRYLPFVVTKSSSSYSDKRIMIVNHPSDRITLEDGADADREQFFASDASILWDESADEFVISKNIKIPNLEVTYNIERTGSISTSANRSYDQTDDDGDVYSGMVNFFTTSMPSIILSGGWGSSTGTPYASRAWVSATWNGSNTITFYDWNFHSFVFTSGGSTPLSTLLVGSPAYNIIMTVVI